MRNVRKSVFAPSKVAVILLTICGLASGCGDPPPEITPSSSAAATDEEGEGSSRNNHQNQASVITVENRQPTSERAVGERTNFGAEIGGEVEQRKVRECVEKGRYYNRTLSECDAELSIAEFDCTIDGLASGMGLSTSEVSAMRRYFGDGGELDGYSIDQCPIVDGYVRIYAVRMTDDMLLLQRYISIKL